MKAAMKRKENKAQLTDGRAPETSAALLRELVAHLRQNRTQLREEWARRITDAELLTAMSKEEIFSEATSVYDNYVEVLETGSVEALQAYARSLSERIIPRGVETHEVVGIVTCSLVLCSKNIRPISSCSTACWTPTSRLPTASPTPLR